MNKTEQDVLLAEDDSRYVMFPIKDQTVWEMYKKAMASFWTAEEVDLSKDINDWEKSYDSALKGIETIIQKLNKLKLDLLNGKNSIKFLTDNKI